MRGANYRDEHVFCRSHVSETTHSNFTNFLCMLPILHVTYGHGSVFLLQRRHDALRRPSSGFVDDAFTYVSYGAGNTSWL